MGLFLSALHTVYRASLRAKWKRFEQALREPERAQSERLKYILSANSTSLYGASHRFAEIDGASTYRARTPIVDYDGLEPWITRIALGESNILTREPVLMMEKTGGSTSFNKLIPYTRGLKDEFTAAADPWIFNLYSSCPELIGKRSYWSLSPVTRVAQRTEGGLPIGFESDSDYLGPIGRYFMNRTFAVPNSVARLHSMDEWQATTCRHLLAADDLGMISVWSPSFLTLLMDEIARSLPDLLKTLPATKARAIAESVEAHGAVTGEALWPRLRLISTWVDADAADHLPGLRRYFPRTEIQGKGLLATEGVVSIPIHGRSDSVLAVDSHFLEFLDVEHPTRPPVLAQDLKIGGTYSPVLTTSGGLYRYHLKDKILCTGKLGATPTIRFLGKLDRVSDLCGEKITSGQVDRVFEIARRTCGLRFDFALLAPVPSNPSHYCLFIETDMDDPSLQRALRAIETGLSEGHHYSYCRNLGQLGPMTCERVRNGWETYMKRAVEAGQRAGDVKPTHFDTRKFWFETFSNTSKGSKGSKGKEAA